MTMTLLNAETASTRRESFRAAEHDRAAEPAGYEDRPIVPAATSDPVIPSLLARRILVVEDDRMVRDVEVMILHRAAFEVASAADGEVAWKLLRSSSFDLVITDHCMPRLTGMDLIRRLRAARLAIPVILLSAYSPRHEPDFEAMLSPGMALDKPFTVDRLLGAVRRYLGPVGTPSGPGAEELAEPNLVSVTAASRLR